MQLIELTGIRGKNAFTMVDDIDFEYLNQWKWQLRHGYATRNKEIKGKYYHVFMHRLINKTPDGLFTDHINLNKLDNRKTNLRNANKAQNSTNRIVRKDNTSGYKGVVWHNVGNGYWKAYITIEKKHKHLGLFRDKIQAATAYNEAAIKYFGQYARLNII